MKFEDYNDEIVFFRSKRTAYSAHVAFVSLVKSGRPVPDDLMEFLADEMEKSADYYEYAEHSQTPKFDKIVAWTKRMMLFFEIQEALDNAKRNKEAVWGELARKYGKEVDTLKRYYYRMKKDYG